MFSNHDASKIGSRPSPAILDFGLVARVRLDGNCASAQRACRRRGLLRGFGVLVEDDGNISAILSESERKRKRDP